MTVLERLDDLDVVAPPTGERAKLRRELGRLDTIFFLISAMVVVDTIGAVAIGGAQAFTWLGVLFVTFFIPSALASAELGAALPEEGGAYVWVREAFGGFAGSLSSLLYWAGTPMWLGGSVAVVALTVHQRFIGELSMTGRYAFGITFVVLATLAAVVPLRYGKWVPTSGAIGQIALLSLFTLSVVLYGIRHGVHGISVGDLSPSTGVLIAVVPVLHLLLRRRRAAVRRRGGDGRPAARRARGDRPRRRGPGAHVRHPDPGRPRRPPGSQHHLVARADRRHADRVHASTADRSTATAWPR